MSNLCRQFDRLPTVYVKECGYIPVVLTNAASIIERNIKTKDLFQTQGVGSKVHNSLSQLSTARLARIKNLNVHDVIEAMKTFLVRLPDPLLPDHVCDALISASQANSVAQYSDILAQFRKAEPHHFAITHFMMNLLNKVSQQSMYNGMDVRKLATIFVLDIIKPLKLEDSNDTLILSERLQRLPYLIMVIENLVNNAAIFKTVNAMKLSDSQPKGSPSTRSVFRPQLPTGLPGISKSSMTESPVPGSSSKTVESPSRIERYHGDSKESGPRRDRQQVQPQTLTTRAFSEPTSPQKSPTNTTLKPVKRAGSTLPVVSVSQAGNRNMEKTAAFTTAGTGLAVTGPEDSQERKETGTQAGQPVFLKDYKKKSSPLRPAASRVKRPGAFAESNFRTSPKRRRPLSKSKVESAESAMNRSLSRSADRRCNSRSRNANFSPDLKRKRKSRSNGKKSKSGQSCNASRCPSGVSNFSAFHPDEEITPWDDAASNSDDTSLMAHTIKNPRVLFVQPQSSEKALIYNNEDMDLDPFDLFSNSSHPFFLISQGFRTIKQQEGARTADVHETSSLSDSTLSGEKPDVFVSQSRQSNRPVTLADQGLNQLKVTRLKTGVAAPQSSKFASSATTATGIRETAAGSKGKPTAGTSSQKQPQKGSSPRFNRKGGAGAGTTNVKFRDPAPVTASSRDPGPQTHNLASLSAPISSRPSVTGCSSQRIKVSMRNGHPRNIQRYREQLFREELDMNQSGSSVVEWLVDIFLVCVTLFCTCFVFYVHQNGQSSHDVWHSN